MGSNLGQALLVPARGVSGGLPVTSGLVAWYSADKIVGLANGDPVASWPDSSGQGNTASQATQSKQPTLSVGAINGRSAVLFDGVDDNMAAASVTINQPGTILAVAKLINVANRVIVDGTTPSGRWMVYRPSGLELYAGTTGVVDVSGTITSPFIVRAIVNGASSTIALNGTAGTSGNAGSNNLVGVQIGSVNGGTSGFWSGLIASIVYYSRALSVSELVALDHYFSAYYSIAVSD